MRGRADTKAGVRFVRRVLHLWSTTSKRTSLGLVPAMACVWVWSGGRSAYLVISGGGAQAVSSEHGRPEGPGRMLFGSISYERSEGGFSVGLGGAVVPAVARGGLGDGLIAEYGWRDWLWLLSSRCCSGFLSEMGWLRFCALGFSEAQEDLQACWLSLSLDGLEGGFAELKPEAVPLL
ncbi:hypothetical protein U1Q18_000732 [Sarracenia purpurea var. burkii]